MDGLSSRQMDLISSYGSRLKEERKCTQGPVIVLCHSIIIPRTKISLPKVTIIRELFSPGKKENLIALPCVSGGNWIEGNVSCKEGGMKVDVSCLMGKFSFSILAFASSSTSSSTFRTSTDNLHPVSDKRVPRGVYVCSSNDLACLSIAPISWSNESNCTPPVFCRLPVSFCAFFSPSRELFCSLLIFLLPKFFPPQERNQNIREKNTIFPSSLYERDESFLIEWKSCVINED